ncbi:TetR/AcrR family transcriptional regulator [Enterococcus sp. BWR-S5]|uniref:TetR/AcrR family transcriptional regulator n=1 Tax=Enterococcus sp. BWR-S5 TaxID=2787714 RepID=UPI0019226435|nr:TetR/AcrR family transcriptional regulator [Enterococcus sp. BWR-S5]MBL1224443.1 TetR/AcrR family transcriptional regulator [Enterococcus sp. BWR-S5]
MVRRKVYTKDQILKASYSIILKEGFSGITARNVADKMGISTQPIYLEFKNMEDLKVSLLLLIYDELENEYYNRQPTGDPVIDMGLNIIEFAKKDRKLFMYMYIDPHGYGDMLRDLSYEGLIKKLQLIGKYQGVSNEVLADIYEKIWITAAGIATLLATETIIMTTAEINETLEESIQKHFL